MFSFLFFIFIFIGVIVLAIILSVLNTVFGIFRSIFSFGKNPRASAPHTNNTTSTKKKIFDDNDGEYVDYEEVKDK
jgi:hypothetical protein